MAACTTTIKKKTIVFDMDETLGHFVELNMFWTSLKEYLFLKNLSHYIVEHKSHHYNLKETTLFKVLDLYPEFLRPNILGILKYLRIKQEQGDVEKIMIYTNNNGPKEWVLSIKDYFNTKLAYPIFDHVIAAFMVNGKIIEPKRTTFFKTYDDLVNCAKLSKHAEVCFIDDQYHPHMINDKVYYIYTQPYIIRIDYAEMISRFLNSNIIPIPSTTEFTEFMLYKLKSYAYSVTKTKITEDDRKMSQEIIRYLQTFIRKGIKRYTLKGDKIKLKIDNKTRKHRVI
jgi:hypothetical protein